MHEEREQLDEAVQDTGSEVDDMEKRSQKLEERVQKVKSDWRAKQEDSSIPGAQTPADDQS